MEALNNVIRKNLKAFYNDIKEEDNAHLFVIDGRIGSGKTTLYIHCGDYINSLENKGLLSLDLEDHKQLSLGGVNFREYLEECRGKYSVLGYDEAGDFDKRRSLSKQNVNLKYTFEKFRAYKIMVFLITPSIFSLDKTLLNQGFITALFHCRDKNKQKGYSKVDIYDQYGINLLYRELTLLNAKQKYKKTITAEWQIYGRVQPNIRGIRFPDLDPERAKKLNLLSTLQKSEDNRKTLIKELGLLNYKEIALSLNKSEIWVKKAVGLLGAKPYKLLKNRAYFKPEIIDLLKNEKVQGSRRVLKNE